MRGYGKSQKAYEKAKKDYKKKTGFSTVGEKMKSKGYTPPKSDNKNKILKDLDEAQKQKDNTEKAKDQASLNVGASTGGGRQTTDFINDLKDAYKAGLFTGGTKTKDFMSKYGLTGDQIRDLRMGIDQGLGTRIDKKGNVLTDLVGDLRGKGILTTSGPGAEFLQQRASEIYEPGMKKSNMFLPFEDPQNIFEKGANLTTQYNPFLNIVSGIFGSSAGQQATYFGREKGLEGEELDQFAAAVANDRNLYNQMMATPEMQEYELNEFRAEANKNAMAKRRSGDPDPISGSQGGGDDEGDDGTTDPGTDPVYTPPPQNYFTFFDPNLGRYRSGTYDEYLQYVTAKDGGIIQLENGGDPDEEQFVRDNKIVNLRNILSFIRDNKEMPVNTEGQKKVQAETDKLLGDMLKDRFTDMEGITGLTVKSGDAVKMAEEDQPIRDLLGRTKESLDGILQNIKERPDLFGLPRTRPPEEKTTDFIEVYVENEDGTTRIIEVPMNQDTLQKLRDGTYRMTNRSAVDKGIFISPMSMQGPTIDPQTAPYIMQEGQREEFDRINPIFRGIPVQEQGAPNMYEAADGGIIGLKEGGMNDMMQADSLMFNDPSDEGQWEYNV